MKQPDLADIGTQMDVVKYRLMAAKDDLDTAKLTFQAGKFRAANNRAYYLAWRNVRKISLTEVLRDDTMM